MAPAITLNRMYHCVPSSSSTIDPRPRPPPIRISTSNTIGNSAVAGTDAAICASGPHLPRRQRSVICAVVLPDEMHCQPLLQRSDDTFAKPDQPSRVTDDIEK